jgi:hypothetical protein
MFPASLQQLVVQDIEPRLIISVTTKHLVLRILKHVQSYLVCFHVKIDQ